MERQRVEQEKIDEAKKKKNPRSRYAAMNSKKSIPSVKATGKSLNKPSSAEINKFKSPTNKNNSKVVGSFEGTKPASGKKPNGRVASSSRLVGSSRIGVNTRSTTTLLRK